MSPSVGPAATEPYILSLVVSRQPLRGAPVILKLVIGVYISAAALLPLAHHDIACHLKSASTHCTSCVIGSAGDLAADITSAGKSTLNQAGGPAMDPDTRIDARSRPAASGRGPPSAV